MMKQVQERGERRSLETRWEGRAARHSSQTVPASISFPFVCRLSLRSPCLRFRFPFASHTTKKRSRGEVCVTAWASEWWLTPQPADSRQSSSVRKRVSRAQIEGGRSSTEHEHLHSTRAPCPSAPPPWASAEQDKEGESLPHSPSRLDLSAPGGNTLQVMTLLGALQCLKRQIWRIRGSMAASACSLFGKDGIFYSYVREAPRMWCFWDFLVHGREI